MVKTKRSIVALLAFSIAAAMLLSYLLFFESSERGSDDINNTIQLGEKHLEEWQGVAAPTEQNRILVVEPDEMAVLAAAADRYEEQGAYEMAAEVWITVLSTLDETEHDHAVDRLQALLKKIEDPAAQAGIREFLFLEEPSKER